MTPPGGAAGAGGLGVELGPLGRRRRAGHPEPDRRRRACAAGSTPCATAATCRWPSPSTGPARRRAARPGASPRSARCCRINQTYTGVEGDAAFNDDNVTMSLAAGTHVDALGHVSYAGLLYNGFPDSTVSETDGLTRCGAEKLGPIVSRGVLLDVAAVHGVGPARARLRHHRRGPRCRRRPRPDDAGAGGRGLCAHRVRCACSTTATPWPTTTTARACPPPPSRWIRGPRPGRGVHRHLRVRGVAAPGLGRHDGRAHDPPAGHGPDPGPELRLRGPGRRTARPTASTSSCSAPAPSRSPAGAAPRFIR